MSRGDSLLRVAPVLFLGAIGALTWLTLSRFVRYEVQGASMSPALLPGDFIMVDRMAYRGRMPRPGEIVLAPDPRQRERLLVKRVERVDIHGSVWLLGDNSEESTDSRQFGAVPREDVVGRVRWRYWPPIR